jgi:hypothetical protein
MELVCLIWYFTYFGRESFKPKYFILLVVAILIAPFIAIYLPAKELFGRDYITLEYMLKNVYWNTKDIMIVGTGATPTDKERIIFKGHIGNFKHSPLSIYKLIKHRQVFNVFSEYEDFKGIVIKVDYNMAFEPYKTLDQVTSGKTEETKCN